ncbi:MAG TPA: DUF2971 domain-containing protein [Prolixibacteraceae bacterium]|jgi:hypothetical protein
MVRRITDTLAPEILYKYRDWTNRNHRKMILHQEIYFPRPSEFNDPFDGNIPIRWDLMPYEECLEKNIEIINIAHKDKDQSLVRAYAKKVTDDKTLWHPDKLVKERPEQLEKWNSIIGLFSMSSMPDNILMWSHYSFNHTGFVVGFNTNSLINDYDFDYIEPIIYQTQYPTISGLDDTTAQFHKKFFCKSDLWTYEGEWRISKNHIKKRVVKLHQETINRVIIGSCTAIDQTKSIIKLSKKSLGADIPIFKASKNVNNFGLIIKQIE